MNHSGSFAPPQKSFSSLHMTNHPQHHGDVSYHGGFQRPASQPFHTSDMNGSGMGLTPAAATRSTVFGSCIQVLSTVITALFHTVNQFQYYSETTADNNTTRKAKLLYVALLEKVQKERGEWQGFSPDKDGKNGDSKQYESAMDILVANLASFNKDESMSVLNEVLEVSFRNLRGSLICPDLYARHKKKFASISMGTPPSLNVLLLVRGLLNDMEREEKLCMFRLLSLWHALALVNPHSDLRKIIEDKHTQVFSENSEIEFMTGRKSNRHDVVAIELLQILVQYRDVLFSDIEFLLIKQELQLNHGMSDTPEVETETEEEEDPATSSQKHSLVDDDTYEAIPMAVAVDATPPPSASRRAASTSSPNRRLHKRNSSNEPVVTVRMDRANSTSPPKRNPRRHSYLDLSMDDAIQLQPSSSSSSSSSSTSTTSEQPPPPSQPYLRRQHSHSSSPRKTSAVVSPSSSSSNHHVSPRRTSRQESRTRVTSPSISPRKQRQPSTTSPLPQQRATYRSDDIIERVRESDALSKNIFSLSMAAATVCTMATMVFFAVRNKS